MSDPIIETRETRLTRHLPQDLRSSEAVRAFLSDPLSTTTAMITAALASGREEIVLAGGRIAQAILKGRTFKQLGLELEELRKKGKIREDYADSKYGFNSFVELMTMIESDAPDADKLSAAKAMFVALNSPNAPEGEAFLRFQLFRAVLKLSGSQIVLLGICHKLHKERIYDANATRTAQNWLNMVAQRIGHRGFSLIELDETALIKAGIITDRLLADRSAIDPNDARLTDLGVKLCELIESYSGDIPKSETQKR
jgi:hypothetical protein